VKTKLHDGREHLAAYDSLGRLDSTTDAKLQVIRYTYLLNPKLTPSVITKL
jgi:YD repeat-containing protein